MLVAAFVYLAAAYLLRITRGTASWRDFVLLGLVLGLVRKKTNTTTSAIVHGTYDFLLIAAAALQIPSPF